MPWANYPQDNLSIVNQRLIARGGDEIEEATKVYPWAQADTYVNALNADGVFTVRLTETDLLNMVDGYCIVQSSEMDVFRSSVLNVIRGMLTGTYVPVAPTMKKLTTHPEDYKPENKVPKVVTRQIEAAEASTAPVIVKSEVTKTTKVEKSKKKDEEEATP
jgi:hypothetical protein